MIGNTFNYDDVFFRNITIGVLDTLEGEIYWNYNFSSGVKKITVPFYYSLTGDEKFLLDTFVDDVVSDNRLNELNTDIIPRGVLTMTGFDMLTDQSTNPNVWVTTVHEDDGEMKNALKRIRPIQVSIKYELSIILNSENDYFKCSEALMNTIGVYKYFAIQFNSFNINAVMQLPDSNQFEITRDVNMTTRNSIKLTTNFEVLTTYPGFRRDDDSNIRNNSGPSNTPNGWNDAYQYDSFKGEDKNNVIIPKRTKWYANIHQSNGNPSNNRNIEDTNVENI